eukprot:g16884.t1
MSEELYTQQQLEDVNINDREILITPRELLAELPVSQAAGETVAKGRKAVTDILDKKDPRILVVVGPCSIHDPEAAMDYARRLRELADKMAA